MNNVLQGPWVCNVRPNQHLVDDLLWQADAEADLVRELEATNQEEQAARARLGATALGEGKTPDRAGLRSDMKTWIDARERSVTEELTALWERERELTRELAGLWAFDLSLTQKEGSSGLDDQP